MSKRYFEMTYPELTHRHVSAQPGSVGRFFFRFQISWPRFDDVWFNFWNMIPTADRQLPLLKLHAFYIQGVLIFATPTLENLSLEFLRHRLWTTWCLNFCDNDFWPLDVGIFSTPTLDHYFFLYLLFRFFIIFIFNRLNFLVWTYEICFGRPRVSGSLLIISILDRFEKCFAPWPVCRSNAILVAIVGGISWDKN